MNAPLRLGLTLALLAAALAAPPPAGAQTQGAARPGAETGAETGSQVRRPGRSGLPLPRFVSLRAPKVNLRTGPGIRYPIDWVYTRKGMPLEVVAEFETWRRIRDWQGSVGWVHQSMLTGRRGAMIVGKPRLIRRDPTDTAPGVALLEAGVVGRLLSCAKGWCRIEVKAFEGWIRQDEVYGVYPDETVR